MKFSASGSYTLLTLLQLLATRLDEDYKKPKNVADQVVRTLDEEAITPPDRLRLLALYLLYKDGLLKTDIQFLLQHAQLPPQDENILQNLEFVGARVSKKLSEKIPPPEPLIPKNPKDQRQKGGPGEEYSLSRYETVVKQLLDAHVSNTLDPEVFPYTKPHLSVDEIDDVSVSSASLRSAKPTWAQKRGGAALESRQRIIVFVAGGATYSEARACYEVGEKSSKEVYLVSSHMMTPGLWLRQLGDLTADRRRLGLPSDAPKPKTPKWVFEQQQEPADNGYGNPGPGAGAPMGAMQAAGQGSQAAAAMPSRRSGMAGGGGLPSRPMAGAGGGMSSRPPPAASPVPAPEMAKMNLGSGDTNGGRDTNGGHSGKLHKDKDGKKRNKIFGSKK